MFNPTKTLEDIRSKINNSTGINLIPKEHLAQINAVAQSIPIDKKELYPYSNWINIKERDLNSPIFRVMKSSNLIRMLKERRNFIVHVSKWDDKFEGLAFRNPFKRDNQIITSDFYKKLYGQCWCLNPIPENYIWNFYKNLDDDDFPVRVQSTVGKIWNSFTSNFDNDVAEIGCFCGKVRYKSVEKIRKEYSRIKFLNDILSGDKIRRDKGIALFLFEKFEYFKFEKEFRFIYLDWNEDCKKDILPLEMDLLTQIDSIEVSPYVDISQMKKFRNTVLKMTSNTRDDFVFQRDDSIPLINF